MIHCPKCKGSTHLVEQISEVFYIANRNSALIWVLEIRECHECTSKFGVKQEGYSVPVLSEREKKELSLGNL